MGIINKNEPQLFYYRQNAIFLDVHTCIRHIYLLPPLLGSIIFIIASHLTGLQLVMYMVHPLIDECNVAY